MIYILEGPDGCGKTTLAGRLEKRPGTKVVRMLGGRTEPHHVSRNRTFSTLRMDGPEEEVICERFHALSDAVYRKLDDRQSIFTWDETEELVEGLIENHATLIYCRTSYESALSRKLQAKGDDDPEWMRTLGEKMKEIFRAYDMLVAYLANRGMKVIRYDFTDPWCEDVLKEILS